MKFEKESPDFSRGENVTKSNKLFTIYILDNSIIRFHLLDENIMYFPLGENAFDEFFVNYYQTYVNDQYDIIGKVKKGDIVFDCGAQTGIFSLLAQQQGAFVYAIEPLNKNLVCLEYQSKRGNSIALVPCVVSDVIGQVPFQVHETLVGGGRISSDGNELVMSTTIDELSQRFNLERLDFIKMDIEGSEIEALIGAEQSIKKFKPNLAISAYHWETAPRDLRKLIQSFNPDYKIVINEKGPFCELILHADLER